MSATKPPTATPASTSKPPVSVNVGGHGGKVLGALKNIAPTTGEAGEATQNILETAEKLSIKDNIESAITKHDKDTPVEIDEEEKKITRRILRINTFVTYLLFYTALMMQWLTLLGLSTSVGNFFYEFAM